MASFLIVENASLATTYPEVRTAYDVYECTCNNCYGREVFF